MKTTKTVLVSLLIAASSGLAQEENSIAAGDRIRVWTADGSRPLTGIVQRADSGMLVLKAKLAVGEGATTIPVDSVTALQVSRGTRSKAAVGSTVGGLVGIVFGAVWGASQGESQCSPNSFVPCFEKDEMAIMGAVLFGSIGAGAGALIGLTIRSEDWKEVPVRTARLGLSPAAGGRVSARLVLHW